MRNENLVISNLDLVKKVAHKFTNMGEELDDLIGEGNLALCECANRWDNVSNTGTKFSTYAYKCIYSAMCNFVGNNRQVKMPADKVQMLRKLKKVNDKYIAENNGEKPSVEYLAIELRTTVEQINLILNFTNSTSTVSLEANMGDDDEDNFNYENVLSNDEDNVEFGMNKMEISKLVNFGLRSLNDNDLAIVTMYYGIGCEPMSLREIADKVGISRQSINDRLREIRIKLSRNPYIKSANELC